MAFPDRRTLDVLLTVLLFSLVVAGAYIARAVILIFCFAILFAYLVDPVVRFLQRHSLFFKNLRGPHVAETYLGFLLLIALLGSVLAPGLAGRTVRAVQAIPALTERVASGEIATDLGRQYRWDEDRMLRFKAFLVKHRSDIQELLARANRMVRPVIGGMFLIPVLALFFLSSGRALADSAISVVSSEQNRPFIRSVADDLHVMLQHYIRAKVTLSGLSFAYFTAMLLILRFPHALALGLLAGFLEFIPIVGWMITATTIITFGVISGAHWLLMVVAIGVWRMLIDYWIAPRVLGHELELHPLLAIFTLMVGGAIGGLPGVYLSLPLAAAVRVIWRRVSSSHSTLSHRGPLAGESKAHIQVG
jgi:predicted PurR-regulated permease PerM